MISEYDGMIQLFEDDVAKYEKTVKDKDVQIGELAHQLERYKQKITQMIKSQEKMEDEKKFFDDLNQESAQLASYGRTDKYETKFKELQKHYQILSSKYIENQITFSEIKNNVGVNMLNLMEALPESFTGKFHPDIMNLLVLLKTTSDKLYLLFDLSSHYLRERNEVYAKDNIELAAWMILLLDKIMVLHASLYRIELAIMTSES